MVTPADLLNRIAGGDRVAMKALYDQQSAKLLALVMRIAGNRQDAEDIVQDVFVTVWRKAAEFDLARGSPEAWLVTIARNRAIDRVRARGRHVPVSADVLDGHADPQARADSSADEADDARSVTRALASLDIRHAAVIRAAYIEGLSYEELSIREGIPVGTIKTWVFRGLRRMREHVGS